ncbi:hypothetical protein [Mycobacterium colombiense]|nr:hypothetical protein [Mycobacterium colombiense]
MEDELQDRVAMAIRGAQVGIKEGPVIFRIYPYDPSDTAASL